MTDHRGEPRSPAPAMTKQHFVFLAEVLSAVLDREDFDTRGRYYNVLRQFADCLALTNPQFDRRRFLLACGVSEEFI